MAEFGHIAAGSSEGPSLTSLDDSALLTWKGVAGDEGIWYSTLSNDEWAPQARFDVGGSLAKPAVMSLGLGNILTFVRGGMGDESLRGYLGSVQQPRVGDWVIPLGSSAGAPSAASLGGDHYMIAWRGGSGDEGIWFVAPGLSPTPIPSASSSHGPSLARYNGRVYCAWKAGGSGSQLYFSVHDGTEWSEVGLIPGGSSHAPALAEFKGALYAVWKGVGDDSGIWMSTFNGRKWTPQRPIYRLKTGGSPAICESKGRLILAFRGVGDDHSLYWARYDGFNWSPSRTSLEFDIPSITFPDLFPVGGRAHLKVLSDGGAVFSGHFHDSGGPSYDTNLLVTISDIADNEYRFYHRGYVAGFFEVGSRDDDWSDTTHSPSIAENWELLLEKSALSWKASLDAQWVYLLTLGLANIDKVDIKLAKEWEFVKGREVTPELHVSLSNPQPDSLAEFVYSYDVSGGPFVGCGSVTVTYNAMTEEGPKEAPVGSFGCTSDGYFTSSVLLEKRAGWVWTIVASDESGKVVSYALH